MLTRNKGIGNKEKAKDLKGPTGRVQRGRENETKNIKGKKKEKNWL